MLSAFSVENYRAFSRRQDIEIRPLTLFFGRNSAGKSALVRFLPLLAESVQAGGVPIWLGGEIGGQAIWRELVSSATERPSLKFSLTWHQPQSMTAEWEVQGDMDGRWQETQSLSVKSPGVDGVSEVTLERQDLQGHDLDGGKWVGLLPEDGHGGKLSDEIAGIRRNLAVLAHGVQRIGGVRARPPRTLHGGGVPATMRSDGADAVEHLISAALRGSSDPVLDVVQRFFADIGETLVLENPMPGVWRVLLHPMDAPKVRVNLCDTGEGYAQVLPILVALARTRAGGPRLLCLEQPELHLHTHAQGLLAKLLVESANHACDPRILVETHSEVLLMSVQLAIARGEIDPAKVRVYRVKGQNDGTSKTVAVDFDDKGQPNNRELVGAFGEAVLIGRDLGRLQMAPQLV